MSQPVDAVVVHTRIGVHCTDCAEEVMLSPDPSVAMGTVLAVDLESRHTISGQIGGHHVALEVVRVAAGLPAFLEEAAVAAHASDRGGVWVPVQVLMREGRDL